MRAYLVKRALIRPVRGQRDDGPAVCGECGSIVAFGPGSSGCLGAWGADTPVPAAEPGEIEGAVVRADRPR